MTTEVTKMWSRDAFNVQSLKGITKKASVKEGYQVTVPEDYTKVQVSALSDLPDIGTSFPGNPDVRLTDRDFQRLGPIYWLVTMTYEGEFPAMSSQPEVKWSNSASTEAIDEDINGNPITTANGEPIEGVTKEISDLVLQVTRNYRSVNLAATQQYLESVNSDTFQGFAPGTGRLRAFDATQEYNEFQAGYWKVNARIEFRFPYRTSAARAWFARMRHEGYYERVGTRIIRAVDNNKEPTTRPVLLKSDGTRETNPSNADWLEFGRYNPLPYNSLGLL